MIIITIHFKTPMVLKQNFLLDKTRYAKIIAFLLDSIFIGISDLMETKYWGGKKISMSVPVA